MDNKLPRLQQASFVLSAAMITLCLPYSAYAQSPTPQDQRAVQTQDRDDVRSQDITRRDLARFDQFLDTHREVADQLRKTPSLIDDPQFVQNHPALNTYLQDHPGVRQEITQRPDAFMRAEDLYGHDRSLRDRDATGQDRDATAHDRDVRDVNAQDRDATGQDRDANAQDRNAMGQDRDTTAHDRDATTQDRDVNAQDRDARGQDADRRDTASFNRFLDDHREIAEQVRRDPSLLDNRNFVQTHPALQSYLQDNPGVRDQLRQDPNAFIHQEDAYNRDANMRDRDANMRDRDPMQNHMADFGGFLHNHSDIQRDLSRDPSVVKDHGYVQNHTELEAYLNTHPDVRGDLMANPQSFVQGSRQYDHTSGSGAGMNGRGTGTTGSTTGMTGSTTGTSTKPPETPHQTTQQTPHQ